MNSYRITLSEEGAPDFISNMEVTKSKCLCMSKYLLVLWVLQVIERPRERLGFPAVLDRYVFWGYRCRVMLFIFQTSMVGYYCSNIIIIIPKHCDHQQLSLLLLHGIHICIILLRHY